jgi:hypothetical protein
MVDYEFVWDRATISGHPTIETKTKTFFSVIYNVDSIIYVKEKRNLDRHMLLHETQVKT